MAVDPDSDLPYDYTPPSTDGSNNDDDFNGSPSSNAGRRGKLTTRVSFSLFYSKKRKDFRNNYFFLGQQLAIIIGSVIGGLLLFGLLFSLIFFLCCKKKGIDIKLNFIVKLTFIFYFSFKEVSRITHIII